MEFPQLLSLSTRKAWISGKYYSYFCMKTLLLMSTHNACWVEKRALFKAMKYSFKCW